MAIVVRMSFMVRVIVTLSRFAPRFEASAAGRYASKSFGQTAHCLPLKTRRAGNAEAGARYSGERQPIKWINFASFVFCGE